MPLTVQTYALELAILADATAAMAILAPGVKVALLAAPFTPTRQTTYAQITAAGVLPTYTGYAEQAVAAWSAPYVDTDGSVKTDGGDLLFQPTDAASPNTIHGWALVDGMDLHVYQVTIFDVSVPLPDAAHGLPVDVVFQLCA